MTERLPRAHRKATNNAGIISANGKTYTVLLRDISKTGARVRLVAKADAFPSRFHFRCSLEKINTECDLVWRRGNDLGVKFVGRTAAIKA